MICTIRDTRAWNLVRPYLTRLGRDEDGTVAIVTALSLTALVGFAALAVDVSSWQSAKRSIQGAADMAAYSAATASQKNNGSGTVTQAEAVAASFGYVNNQGGVTVTVNQPPTSGSYTSNASAIEVVITQPQPRFFAGLFLSTGPTITARAVALASSLHSACILALDTSANHAINVSGSANIHAPNCDIVSNSTTNSAINMSGGATVDAACLVAVGQVQTTSGLTEARCTTPKINASSTPDPYASVAAPTASGSCITVPGGSPITLSAGNYCSGLVVNGTVTFNPGTYYVNGNFAIQGSSNVTGSGVTFYLAGTNNAISGSAVATLSAPTSGTYAGLLFFASRSITNATNNFSGSSQLNLTGALYFPTQDFSFTGGTSSTSCLQIVVGTLTVSGAAYLGDSCSGTGVANISVNDGTSGTLQLVE